MRIAADYGKVAVTVYRARATPLRVPRIPESAFVGRSNALFAVEIDLDAFGDAFLASYSEGDNRAVIATDSMKNFIHAMALEAEAATLESFLQFVGRRFLETYPQADGARLHAREIPFVELGGDARPYFRRSRADAGVAELRLARRDGRPDAIEHRSGREGLELVRLGGSSFEGFVRDSYTTLPEARDRPLVLHLDLHWRYRDVADAVGTDHARYVASEQARDLAESVFAAFPSRSIQHLVHEIGQRLLARYAQLDEVSLEAQNLLWDAARTRDDGLVVYTDPRPAYGRIALTLRR